MSVRHFRPPYLPSILAVLLSCTAPPTASAQDSTYAIRPRLLLDLPLIDAPYLGHAATMAANKRLGITDGNNAAPGAGDLLRGYESPSMQQALAITKDLHATNYYFTNKLWNGTDQAHDQKALPAEPCGGECAGRPGGLPAGLPAHGVRARLDARGVPPQRHHLARHRHLR
jgi:hypothetical protein